MSQPELVDQMTSRTSRKVQYASFTAAWIAPASVLLSKAAVHAWPMLEGVETELSAVAAAVITGVATLVVGYMTRERRENMVLVGE